MKRVNVRAMAVLCLVVGLCACASTPPVVTRITTEPPGARIEVDGNNLGPSPVTITLRQTESSHRVKGATLIQAFPVEPGQLLQTKLLQRVPAPAQIHFDMYLQPVGTTTTATQPAGTNAPPAAAPVPSPK